MPSKYMRRPVTPEGAEKLRQLDELVERHRATFEKIADSIAKGKRRSV